MHDSSEPTISKTKNVVGRTTDRSAFWPAVLLVVLVVLLNRLTNLPIAVQAEIWVAFGTLCLALATYSSVQKSQQLLALEKRRHEASFVPLVQVKPPGVAVPIKDLVLENAGPGIALDVILIIRGYYTGNASGRFGYMFDGAAIGPYHNLTVTNESLQAWPLLQYNYILERADIWYHDMFGNRFITRYKDPGLTSLTRYDWMRHTELLPDLTNAETPLS